MADYNWSSFTKRIDINAPVKSVYDAWATTVGIESWFLRLSEVSSPDGNIRSPLDPYEAGDKYRWLWHGWPDSMEEKGNILFANGMDQLQFTFGPTETTEMYCTVLVYIQESTTICELTQQNIPVDENGKTWYHLGCMTGWTFYMANLKSILEGGIDLRNRNENLKNMINS